MKIVYIAEKEELQELVRESIHHEIEKFMKSLDQKTTPERLSLPEAAQYMGIRRSTMYKLTSSRKIPFYKFGRSIFFYIKELDEWRGTQSHQYRTLEDMATEHLALAARRKRKY